MKYFSIEDWKTWEPWDRIQADRKRYHEYIGTIRHKLPPDLLRLCDFSLGWSEKRLSLNDCQMQQISTDYAAQTVTFVLSGGYDDAGGRQIGLRCFTLKYSGVTVFHIGAGSESAYNPVPDWEPQAEPQAVITSDGITFDDHGWDEIELLGDGMIEHRMLFASGTEIAVRFRGFTLDTVDDPYPAALSR